MDNYIGIDVAKSTLQVFIPNNEMDIEIENSLEGLKKLYSKLKKQYRRSIEDIVFIYESTGSYSAILEHYCQSKSIKCFKVGAYQSASFSKVVKNRSKTDKLDARMLSQMHILAKEGEVKVPERDVKAHQIRSLIKYYQSLVKEERRKANYLEAATYNLEDSYVLKKVKLKITQLQKEQSEVIEKIMEIIKGDPEYLEAYNNIISIKGIGEKSAIILLYLFLRYPNASRQQLTALCGLDPIQRSSGTSVQHKERISKQGLSLIRDILYMPTMVAVRYNNEMQMIYEKLVDRGKPKMVAQMAVMRKIILLAHSLYKNKQQYDPERYLMFQQLKEENSMK
ncbi:MAG TPA: IS110 family transposase [Sulfurovum sp.]|uniref:IS110 family transposase n=1 Tax=Sulfurovum sp. TaxID=1969726 RepID=UPI002F94DC51